MFAMRHEIPDATGRATGIHARQRLDIIAKLTASAVDMHGIKEREGGTKTAAKYSGTDHKEMKVHFLVPEPPHATHSTRSMCRFIHKGSTQFKVETQYMKVQRIHEEYCKASKKSERMGQDLPVG